MNGIKNKINGTINKKKGLFGTETFKELRFIPPRNGNNAAIAHYKNAAFSFLIRFYFIQVNYMRLMYTEENLIVQPAADDLKMVGADVLLLVSRMNNGKPALRFQSQYIAYRDRMDLFVVRNYNIAFHNAGVSVGVMEQNSFPYPVERFYLLFS